MPRIKRLESRSDGDALQEDLPSQPRWRRSASSIWELPAYWSHKVSRAYTKPKFLWYHVLRRVVFEIQTCISRRRSHGWNYRKTGNYLASSAVVPPTSPDHFQVGDFGYPNFLLCLSGWFIQPTNLCFCWYMMYHCVNHRVMLTFPCYCWYWCD
jgi:hypothetical protein